MKQPSHIADSNLADNQPVPDSDQDSATAGSGFLAWLKHLFFYICAVAATCAIGLYFLWQIPILRDPASLLRNTANPAPSRPLSTVMAPPTPSVKPQTMPQPPTSPAPPVPGQAPGPGDNTAAMVALTYPAPETSSTPNAVPPSLEPLPSTPDGQTDPSVPLADTSGADTLPPPPQSEIEQLLAEAQQHMDTRRFTAPASGNALRNYQRVLELEPNHPAALEGIQRIATYYQDAATESLRQGRLDESLAYISRGLRAAPKNQDLLNLRREVRLVKQREQEEQQILLEAQRRQTEWQTQEQLRRRALESQQQQPWWRQQPGYDGSSGFNQR